MKRKLLAILMSLAMVFTMMPMTAGKVFADEPSAPPVPLASEITVKAYTDRISVVVNSDRYTDGVLFYPIASMQKATPEKLNDRDYVLHVQDNTVGHEYIIDEREPGTQYYVYVAAFLWQPGYFGYKVFSDWSEPVAVKTQSVPTEKKANPLKIKGKTSTVKYSKLKKKNQTLSVGKVISFTKKGQGKVTYAKASGNKKIIINKKTGKVTVKKKLKKGTYKVKVKVKAAGNSKYKPVTKTVTFKIKVK